MKGVELPVNVLILVAIGVIVLIGLVVLLGIGTGQVSPILVEGEKTKACDVLVNTFKCQGSPSSIIVDSKKVGVPNLQELCNKYKGCGASTVTSGTGISSGTQTSQLDPTTCCRVNVCGCPP